MKPHFSIKPDYGDTDIKIHEPDVESVMREAAFVSSEGKVYRLFSENENPALGSHLKLPASPFVKEPEDDYRQFDILRSSGKDEFSKTAISFERTPKEQKEYLTLDETFKKMRAVEGICGRKQKPVSSLSFLSPQERNEQTKTLTEHISTGHISTEHTGEKKKTGISLTQIVENNPLPSVPSSSISFLSVSSQTVPENNTAADEIEVSEPSADKSVIHLTVVKLPETLYKRSFGLPFRKKKPAKITVEKIENTEECNISVPQPEKIVEKPAEITAENEIHHQPSVTENQMTAAFLAAGEEFRTDAAAVWSARVDSLEERALEQIKKLSVHLIELYKQGKRIISFNSFFSGEGCTTVAACAARELAAQGYYVLLADTNEHHPELTSQFSPLTDSDIYGIIPLEEKLHFLPFCDAMIESEVDGKPVMQHFTQIIAAMKNDYDFILLDNGGLSEHRLEERVKHWNEMDSDGVLLVLKQQNIQRINISAVSGRLQQHRIELAGITENYKK